jgi:hypothetical protein
VPLLEALEARLAPTCSPAFIDNGVLTLNGDNTGNQIETYIEGTGEFREQIFRFVNDQGGYSTTGDFVSRFTSIQINPGAGNNNVTIDTAARPLLVNSGGGLDDVFVGQNGLVFTAPITVQNPPVNGYTYLHVTDQNNPSATTATLTDTGLTLQWGGQTQQINFFRQQDLRGLDVNLGYAGNVVNVVNTPQSGFSGGMQTFLEPGSGPNSVSIRGTTGSLVLQSTHVGEHVFIGDNNSVQGIHGGIRVENAPDFTWLDVLDQADPTPRTVEVFTGGLGNAYGVIDGLAPAQIQFKYADTSLVQLWTGLGGATVRVDATAVPTVVVGNGGLSVNVGFNGSLADIQGDLSISNRNGSTSVEVDDRNRGGARSATLDTYHSGGADFARLQGLAGGTIYAQAPNTGLLTVRTGTGPVTAAVLSTPVPTSVTAYGPLTVNVGNVANRLDDIRSPLTVNGQAGSTTLNVSDQGNPTADRHYEIYADTVKRILNLGPPVTYDAVINYANIGTLNVNGGRGYDVFDVEGTAAGTNTTLNGGSGGDEFLATASHSGPDSLLGPLAVHGRPGTLSYLVYYDYNATAAQTYTLSANTLSRTGAAPVTFDNLIQVILLTANVGGNNINVPSVAAGVIAAFNPANGDTITIGANQTLAAVQGQVVVNPADNISANVVIDDSSNATPPPGPITFSNDVTYGFSIRGLVPEVIYLAARQNTTLTTSLLTGAGDKTFNVQAAPRGVALNLNAGRGTNRLDYTGYAGNVLVDLALGSATGFSGISHIQNAKGASGGGIGFYNVLIGNGGNVLTGGTGRRNILVAGGSASTLIGGDQDDLLIGGSTAYDTEAGLVSWQAIAAYWAGPDDYLTRVANLTSGAGVPLLDATTVFGNGGGNTMIGNGELALIFSDGLDHFTLGPPYPPGFDPNSVVVPITP